MNEQQEACDNRGPRIGEDGTRCRLPRGHTSTHAVSPADGRGWVEWLNDAPRPMTAEQQGSDESGEGLRRDEFAAERREKIIEALSWWEDDDGRWGHDRASDVLAAHEAEWMGAEAALATARRDADELRDRLAAVEALAERWADEIRRGHAANPEGHGALSTHERDHDELRAALANPSAAQGEWGPNLLTMTPAERKKWVSENLSGPPEEGDHA